VNAVADPALDFWLRHVVAEGGLCESSGDSAYVVLPSVLSAAYQLPEELQVTADPDVAREEGATLLAAGHPALAQAADHVLAVGDAGYLSLERPAAVPPGRDVLQAAVRDAFPVDHGKIEVSGEPSFVLHPVIRVGALITYELSAEDHFQEEAQRWVDVPSRRELPAAVAWSLSRAFISERAVVPGTENLLPAIAYAHGLMDSAAAVRRSVLAAEVSGGFEAERGRAVAYYADAIVGIERRLASAPPERRPVLEQRLVATREEQARRLAEIEEKYQARHAIRPYRLHVLLVPAMRLAADVLRGSRRYPMSFDWLLPAAVFAPARCPSCSGEAPLVAGKEKLGCETCLPPKRAAAAVPASPPKAKLAPTPASKPRPAPKPTPAPKPAPVAKPSEAVSPRKGVPPTAHKDQQKSLATLAERLWTSVATGDRRTMAKIIRPDSPAAALDRVYGSSAFAAIVGMPPGEAPTEYTARADAGTVSGVLLGSSGNEYPYFVVCQGGQVAEVLQFPVVKDGAFWNFYWWTRYEDAGRVRVIAVDLDPVENVLATAGPGWCGLPVAIRALAAWGRLADAHQRLLSAHLPPTLAATVIRLVAYRAGGKAPFADAADYFGVPEQDVRRTDRAVRPLLALGPGRPW
jgi:hypothetical protein